MSYEELAELRAAHHQEQQELVNCPRCRKHVIPSVTLGNVYCSNCGRWLQAVGA